MWYVVTKTNFMQKIAVCLILVAYEVGYFFCVVLRYRCNGSLNYEYVLKVDLHLFFCESRLAQWVTPERAQPRAFRFSTITSPNLSNMFT